MLNFLKAAVLRGSAAYDDHTSGNSCNSDNLLLAGDDTCTGNTGDGAYCKHASIELGLLGEVLVAAVQLLKSPGSRSFVCG